MLTGLELDSDGIAELLTSAAFADLVNEAAESVAFNLALPDASAEIQVDSYTTDRAAASVTIKDARGLLWQTRDGILTRAASAAGLEVTEDDG